MSLEQSAVPGALASREELNGILSRAVTASRLNESETLSDDLRMLGDIGVRFIGRSVYAWINPIDQEAEDAHIAAAASLADRVHREIGDEVVLQACLFEAIYPQVDHIDIPAWVFDDLGEAPQTRRFRYEDMTSAAVRAPGQGQGSPWAGGAVPDLSLPETQRWFYYRARRYLEAGIEALHIGQLHLIAGADVGYAGIQKLVAAIRQAAVRHARRGWVILDAHSHGVSHNGRLLLDFTSRPLSARAITSRPQGIALIRRGQTLPGIHPGGWECEDAPVLLEVDNWHGVSLPQDAALWMDMNKRAAAGRWGWDDVSWLAHQTPAERHGFLAYAEAWSRLQGPEWYFQPPVRRPLGRGAWQRQDGTAILYYHANRRTWACPHGWGDEDALAALFSARSSADVPDHQPAHLAWTSNPAARSASGLDVPLPVTLVGDIQEHIGGIVGDASCPWSRLWPVGQSDSAADATAGPTPAPAVFERSFAFPMPADLRFTVMTGGTGIDPTNAGGVSGGPAWALRVERAGQIITFRFDWEARTLEALDAQTGESCLIDPDADRSAEDLRLEPFRKAGEQPPADWF